MLFITAGPSTKLFARGEGDREDNMRYERYVEFRFIGPKLNNRVARRTLTKSTQTKPYLNPHCVARQHFHPTTHTIQNTFE